MFPEIHPGLTMLLSGLIVAVLVAAPISLAYFAMGWLRVRPPRPSLFTLLVVNDGIALAAGAWLGVIAYVRINDREVPSWAVPEVTAAAAIALLVPVVLHALFLYRISASPDIFQPGPKGDTGEKGEKGDRGEDAS